MKTREQTTLAMLDTDMQDSPGQDLSGQVPPMQLPYEDIIKILTDKGMPRD
jgi:hypothetical protein